MGRIVRLLGGITQCGEASDLLRGQGEGILASRWSGAKAIDRIIGPIIGPIIPCIPCMCCIMGPIVSCPAIADGIPRCTMPGIAGFALSGRCAASGVAIASASKIRMLFICFSPVRL